MSQRLENLRAYLKRMNQYNHVMELLFWDMETNTPKLGFEGHAEALTFFSTEQFKMSTAEELGTMLDELANPEEFNALDAMCQFIVTRMKRDYDKNKRIPADFYESYVMARAESENAWKEAKNASDYSIFAPHLEKMITMTREMAAYTDPGKEVYNVLLDQYEEGMDSDTMDRLFTDLKKELIPLVKQILSAKQPDDAKFSGHYDIEEQKKVQKLLLDYIGFDWNKGTVGETEHPFTMNFSSKDVRVTNHYHEHDAISAMFSAIHEGGHAIFEQQVNSDYDGTVAGSCSNMGIHESQSRFYENILGRNKNFWMPIYEKLGALLPQFQNISLDEFYQEINHVRNSFIRVDADELTYCMHIILRYELEKAIFRDGVCVEELPALWNEKMQEYLQITPENDAQGILQDTHWAGGSFGYFPSYLLGSIYDGMYLDTMQEQLGNVDDILREGRIAEITKWLGEQIHQYGNTRTPRQVIESVCGKEVSAEPLIRHFKKKYAELYTL